MQIPRKKFWRNKERATSSLQVWWIQFFLWRVTVKLLFWRGQITSPYFLRGKDQNNELAPLEKSDFLDFENGHFCCLKKLIFDLLIQYYFWPYFQEQLIKKIFLFTKIMGELLWKNQFLGLWNIIQHFFQAWISSL